MNFLEKAEAPTRCPWDTSHMATRETRQYKRFQRQWVFCETCKKMGTGTVNSVPADDAATVEWGRAKKEPTP